MDIVWSVILATPMNQVIDWLHAEVWYRYKGTWIKWQYDAWVLIVMVMITCIVDKLHGPSRHSMLMYIYIYDDTCAYYIIHLSSHEESPAKKNEKNISPSCRFSSSAKPSERL